MKDKLKELIKRMIPNPLRLSIKMFGLVWFILLLHIFLKVTFDYWQPYVIPTPQLEKLSNFIDNHRWLQATLNGVFYTINGILVILCCLRQWWFKDRRETIFIISLIILGFLSSIFLNDIYVHTIFLSIILPLILKPKNWLWIILTFIASNLFMFLSFFLEGLVNSNNEIFIIHTFMQNDYYIMLILNYILFNLIRLKKERK